MMKTNWYVNSPYQTQEYFKVQNMCNSIGSNLVVELSFLKLSKSFFLSLMALWISTYTYGQTSSKTFGQKRQEIELLSTMFPDSANVLANSLLTSAQKSKNQQHLADIYSTLAAIKLWQSFPDEALVFNNKSFDINKKLKNDKELANNYYLFGKLNQVQSDFLNANKNFLYSAELANNYKLYALVQKNYRSISTVFLMQQNLPKTREYAQKAIDIDKKHPNDLNRADDFMVFAPYYDMSGYLDSAEICYDRAFQLYKKQNQQFRMANLLSQKSILYEESDPLKSLELELQSKELFDKIAPQNTLALGNMGNMGQGYFEVAQNDSLLALLKNTRLPQTKESLLIEAEKLLKQCLLLSTKKKSVLNIQFYSGVLAEVQAYKSNFESAYQNLLVKKNLGDSLFSQKNKNAIAKLESEKEILELNAENKQKSNNNKILIGLFLGLSVLSFLGYRNFRNRQKIQQLIITELEKDKQLLAVDSILQGQEEERNRIAKDLHDGLGGMLSGVKMSFMNMKENLIMDAENVKSFEKSIAQLDNTIAELRKVAHNLMPEALAKFGLNDAIKDFCTSIMSATHIDIVQENLGDARKLDNTANIYIYRIIQELVNNAVKHGNPRQILVQLTTTSNKILITVEDDGKGMDANKMAISKGIGITNIQHRVNYFKGNVAFENKTPQGTAVNIELNV